ncbi:uncharacterized protein PV09_07219 [Verruconis gallopava]|uniref:Uncharacterized protein n=1 Tax=Verruconis gallopava TaxID=253628 RepID=A0A0D1YKX2_9PEZI|nr:uncharacterized protein PV09_07219 [Verruconis gallopava]KIW01462.1 hypothetical protein PV09_07219 [Verruconis gallopava]
MASLLRDSPSTSRQSALLLALAAIAYAQNGATQATGDTSTDSGTTATDAGTTATSATGTQNTNDATSVSVSDLPNLSTAASVGAASTVSVTSAPAISTSIFHLSGVPTIAGYGIPTQVVPWTAGAPYMQTSNLPEGTVFIVVGAFLGFLGAAVLAWRGMVAWSLHRSVKRAQLGAGTYSDSMLKLAKPGVATSTAAMGSTLSLERLSAPAGKLSKAHGRNTGSTAGPQASSTAARNSSLFFSPTAGAGAHHTNPAGLMSPSNRSSNFLPAGYYAPPTSTSPASGAKHASIGGTAARLSTLNPNHPANRGYAQPADYTSTGAPSPPDSPGLGRPSTGGTLGTQGTTRGRYDRLSGMGVQENWSNLNVPGGAPSGQRAPSANLEDLFEHHGNGMRGY